MNEKTRVVTAKLSDVLASRLDEVAARIDRSKSWIIRQEVMEWLAEEQLRHKLTLKGLEDVDVGRTFTHEEVGAWFARRKKERQDRRAVEHKPD
jgi:predicted transcriptional regulator